MQKTSIEYQALKTIRGWVAVAFTGRGIVALTLPVENSEKAIEALRGKITLPLARGHGYGKLARDLNRYFRGEKVLFDFRMDFLAGTPFQRRVWAALCTIPYGETQSYGEVARAVGMPRAARAVGQAVGANSIPLLIPCHRVVASDKTLGGYAWGRKWKRSLLQVEGVGSRLRA